MAGAAPGDLGDAGVDPLYATKTVSTGEGGILVSRHDELIEHGRRYRNYGKPDYRVEGLSHRMSEFAAVIGLVQMDRLEEIVTWKNAVARDHLDPLFPSRVEMPDGMVSQRGHLRIGDRLVEHRFHGRRERLVQAGPTSPGESTRIPLKPSSSAYRAYGKSGRSCEPSNFGSPSMTRCSQVTWFRSLL